MVHKIINRKYVHSLHTYLHFIIFIVLKYKIVKNYYYFHKKTNHLKKSNFVYDVTHEL